MIESQQLTRRFGTRTVVDRLDLQVPDQSITGFLGPNGAGKTTTIGLLLGLLKPDSGACAVLGRPPGHRETLAQIGAMVESPSLYDHLTGRENLEITRLMRGVARSEVDRVLGLLDLTRDAHRPVRVYSLGMRQRLGVALAMMGQPKLLILDEPTNGLDPAGIQDLREIIRRLPLETGAAIFLSSHLLSEVEQVARNLVVIHQGRLRYQGPIDGLGAAEGGGLVLRVGDLERAQGVLRLLGYQVRSENGRLWVQAAVEEAARVASCLVGEGCDLYELTPRRENLESRFLALLEEA